MVSDIAARAQRASRLLLAALLAATPVVEIAARLLGGPGPWTALRLSAFVHFAFASAGLMYLVWERDAARRMRAAAIGAACAFMPLFAAILGAVDALPAFQLALVLVGLCGLGLLVHAAVTAPERERRLWRERLVPALLLPTGVALSPFFLWLSGRINPVYDLYVFAFEETLGPRFSVLAVRLFDAVPEFGFICAVSYWAIPLGLGALYALQRADAAVDIIHAFAASTIIGFGLYFVFPVVGPLNAFGSAFPDALPPPGSFVAAALTADSSDPRNGMPSLHASWALLIWFNTRPLPSAARHPLRAFALFNLFATMGLPDAHWITDLIVAVPMTVAVQALCNVALPQASRVRWAAIGGGFGLTFAWFAALWWALPLFEAVPGLSWLAVAVTFAASLALEHALRTDARVPARPAIGVSTHR